VIALTLLAPAPCWIFRSTGPIATIAEIDDSPAGLA
jgi:hypothetical protein